MCVFAQRKVSLANKFKGGADPASPKESSLVEGEETMPYTARFEFVCAIF